MTGPTDDPHLPADLVAQYLRASRERVALVEQMAARLAADAGDRAALESLRHEAHLVFGGAATFGFPEAGRIAQALEDTAKRWLAETGPAADPRGAVVRRFAAELRRAFEGRP
ncbi:MAG TPA: Hpt domain-containing protein [Gemmatimonadales bacterium]